jgi:hypothetical protein
MELFSSISIVCVCVCLCLFECIMHVGLFVCIVCVYGLTE